MTDALKLTKREQKLVGDLVPQMREALREFTSEERNMLPPGIDPHNPPREFHTTRRTPQPEFSASTSYDPTQIGTNEDGSAFIKWAQSSFSNWLSGIARSSQKKVLCAALTQAATAEGMYKTSEADAPEDNAESAPGSAPAP